MLLPLTSLTPQTMFAHDSSPHSVPQTMFSTSCWTPHTMFSVVETPQTMLVAHAFASGLM